jgi:hypothetical protein
VNGVVDDHALVEGLAEVVAVQRLPKVTQRPVARSASFVTKDTATVAAGGTEGREAAEEDDIYKGGAGAVSAKWGGYIVYVDLHTLSLSLPSLLVPHIYVYHPHPHFCLFGQMV